MRNALLIAAGLCLLVVSGPARGNPDNATASIRAERLRCEYLADPLGIDSPAPRLSWIVTSEKRSQVQTAYRILVASSRENLDRDNGDLWDTGKVESGETLQIEYSGVPLTSGMQCLWKVMMWDGEGKSSGWSAPAVWSMGLLDDKDWGAEWIGYDQHLNLRQRSLRGAFYPVKMLNQFKLFLPCPHLRKEFRVEGSVKRATVYVTALGLYELYINGARVGKDYFTPGWTDYNKRVYYLTYDVTDLVRPGSDNAIAAILSDGWYAGNVGLSGQRYYGKDLRLMARLDIEYADGSKQAVVTDNSWRGSTGPIVVADIQSGETYDARLEMKGWNEPGFDGGGWRNVNVTPSVKSLVQAYPGIPVRRIMELKPVRLTEPKKGVYIFDMGQNFAGWARLKVDGAAGDKVVMRFGEMLKADGSLYTANLRTARATDTYILKGGGEETWEPQFTYHGFRYIEITGYPGKPDLESITGIVAGSDLSVTGSIETSDVLVNKIFSNILWTQRSNYFDVPTDCPQRDERLGWTGDAEVFIRTGAYNMDVAPFFTKWIVDLMDGQNKNGSFPDVAPGPVTSATAAWGDAGVICPWNMYLMYGDRRILERNYPAMQRYISFLEKRSPGDASPALGTYGDWLNIDDPTPKKLIATAYFGYSVGLMARIAKVLEKEEDARRYGELFHNICRAFTEKFVDENGRVKGDSQTAYLLALNFDLLPQELRPAAESRLIEKLKERDWCLSTGFLGLHLLLPTLTDFGRVDIAYRLLTNRRYPSWGYSIDQGATTIWERWNSYTKEKGFASVFMNSFNHYAYGSVGEWMYYAMAGIDTDGPAFKEIIIRPRPGDDIKWVKARYDSIRGPISTWWRVEGGALKLDVEIPANTSATVYVPTQSRDNVMLDGAAAGESPDVSFLRMEGGAAVYRAGSGKYSFAVK